MKTRKTRSLKIAFLLDEASFRRLASIFSAEHQQLEYDVYMSDGSSAHCSSADEVLGLSNARERRITRISVNTPWDSLRRAELTLRDEAVLAPVEYSVSGDEKDVFHLSAKLDECLSGLRQWYSRLALLDFTMLFMFGGMGVGCAMAATAALLRLLRMKSPSHPSGTGQGGVDSAAMGPVFGMLMVLALLGSGALLNCVRRRLFPVATFAIGDGVNRHKGQVLIRRTVAVGFGLAVVASMVASLFMMGLFGGR